MTSNVRWFIGLIASVLTALSSQLNAVPETWRPWVAVGGIIATAITGYMIQPPRDEWTEAKRAAVQAKAKAEEKAEVQELKQAAKDIAPKEP